MRSKLKNDEQFQTDGLRKKQIHHVRSDNPESPKIN